MTRIPLDALDGAHLNYEKWGDGPALLALHGFTGAASTWRPLSESLSGQFSVIAVDLLGHGLSDAPGEPALYSMARSCNALAELMDRIRAEMVCWLGYSLGGRLALGAAIALRDRCPALILESASPGLPSLQERTDRTRSDSELAAWIETVGIEPFVDHWEALDLWASQLKLPDQGRGVLRAQRLENRGSGLANSLRGIGTGSQPSFHHDLPGLRTPVCLIAGEEDDRYSRLSGEMHVALPASQLRIVPAAGHAVHFERPPIFNEIVLSFLQSLT